MEDKVFALTISRSFTLYKYLVNIFCLPTLEILRKFIRNIPINVGISDYFLENIKQRLDNCKDYKDKYCVLMFDEVKLCPGLYYNSSTDKIEGLVKSGTNRTLCFADHAQVWMIKGINEQTWKQPLAYTFCKGTSSWQDICYMYKQINPCNKSN